MKIFGDYVPIRAQAAALEQFSDHADPPELLQWLRTLRISLHDIFGSRRAGCLRPIA